MVSDQISPETANSHPIGFPGRRSPSTSPTVAYPSGNATANIAPSASTWTVTGRVTSRVATSPAAHRGMVVSHRPHAMVLVPARRLIAPLLAPRSVVAVGRMAGRRYWTVTAGRR